MVTLLTLLSVNTGAIAETIIFTVLYKFQHQDTTGMTAPNLIAELANTHSKLRIPNLCSEH